MGKKSRRGTTRAGANVRPAAGQGLSKTRSGSKSYSEDGRSLASRDDMSIMALSVDAEPLSTDPISGLPKNVSVTHDYNKENNGTAAAPAPTPVTAPSVAKKDEPAVVAVPVPDPKTKAAASAAPVVTTKKNDDMWSGNLRSVVKAEAAGPAVLDVTADDIATDDLPGDSTGKAVEDDPVLKSRGGFSLTEPAPEEAKAKTNDCQCIIL